MKIHNILNNYHLVDAKNTNDLETRKGGKEEKFCVTESEKHLSSFSFTEKENRRALKFIVLLRAVDSSGVRALN